jgi:hypothetical protein
VLNEARYGAIKTKIMYASYLSSQQLRTFLEIGTTNVYVSMIPEKKEIVLQRKDLDC